MIPEETIAQENLRSNSISSKNRNRLFWVQGLVFAAAVVLFVYVLYSVGFRTIAETVSRIGWGFLIIVATNGLRHFVRTFCIYLAVPKEHRAAKFVNVFAARMAGEAVGIMTFTGPFLGEATKAALLKNRLTLAHSAAAVIVDNILYYVTVALMVLSGTVLMLLSLGTNVDALRYVLFFVALSLVAMLTGLTLAVKYNVKPLSFVLAGLDRRGWLPAFVASRIGHVYDIEKNVVQVYLQRPAMFYALLGLGILAHAISVAEVYLGLYLLNFTPTLTNAYIIESLTKVINLAFSFIPGTVGVYEGGNGLILNALGYTTAVGVALALIRRGAILVWTFYGVVILLWRTAGGGEPNQADASGKAAVTKLTNSSHSDEAL